jgi:hypothetical protein
VVDRPAAELLVGSWAGWLAMAMSAGMTVAGQVLIGRIARVDP